jgi:YesN/AraC family two-component response regulator
MRLQIRNMESERCKTIVKEELNKLRLPYDSVELGEVELKENISNEELQLVGAALKKSGLELIVDNTSQLIEKIKMAIKHLVYCSDGLLRPNTSEYLSKRVNYDYNYISKIFSNIEGITIEKYIILERIERVKKLLITGKFSLSEIAYMLLYSSVAHLSNQFKKVTGLTPFVFRQLMDTRYQNPVNA